VRLELEGEARVESGGTAAASLLPEPALRPQEAMVLEVLRADESAVKSTRSLNCWSTTDFF